ncbi:MAG: SiaB family protein kinase [Putridiphycobacter sp.]|nr:SiaB family protein kinase [Putridiphycobacter sp.]
MTKGITIIDRCNARFHEVFSGYGEKPEGKVTVSHFGEFSQDLVNSLTISIENAMFDSGDKKSVVKRMFSILVEGLQNIRIHGERDEDGTQVSFLIILQHQDVYKISFGNLIQTDRIPKVQELVDFLNKSDQTEVKQHYMEVLSNGNISSKGGAGLGFITMALKTKKDIAVKTVEVSAELSCITVELTLDRL